MKAMSMLATHSGRQGSGYFKVYSPSSRHGQHPDSVKQVLLEYRFLPAYQTPAAVQGGTRRILLLLLFGSSSLLLFDRLGGACGEALGPDPAYVEALVRGQF